LTVWVTISILRFTFAAPIDDPQRRHERLRGALELARWGEEHGISGVSVDEHHATGHGWSSNPVLAASWFLAQTSRMFATADCALAPLWDPIRLAEDIAQVDTLSRGRLHVTLGLGYRPIEYELFAKPFNERGALMDDFLQRLLGAFSRSDPPTWTHPHPPVYVGGGVRATAERAARYGLPLSLPSHLPDIAEHYRSLCRQAGHKPVVVMPGAHSRGMVYLHEDPDKAWAELGRHILWEAQTYAQWSQGRSHSYMHLTHARTAADVRASGRYRFMTPDELIGDLIANPAEPLVLHPLVGGMPLDEAWKSVHLLTERVLPAAR
jgi:alkanesulfonate monooxygenase SsuD/methylene tetrahydromethanopterin reductase-like flavin-dependent oxidoreductase (luciferase family)